MGNGRIFAVCVLFFINTAVFSQVSVYPGCALGLGIFSEKAKSGSITMEADGKAGLVAGGVLDISIIDRVSIEPGIFYSMRGTKMEDSDPSMGTLKVTDNFSYLAIPVKAKLKYPLPAFRPFASAGFNLGILLSASEKLELTGEPTEEIDLKDDLTAVDFGLDLGAGVEFPLPAVVPFLEFSYYLGLTNIAKDAPSDFSIKNKGMEFKAGLKFKA